jgi:hypothetical protein
MTPNPEGSAGATDAARSLQPSDAEIEAWAARERERRQQWLAGPSPEQAAVAVGHERERGEAELGRAYERWDPEFDPARLAQRFLRTTQLVAEGAVSLLLHVSVRDVRERLVHAGLEWEEEFFDEPVPRRSKRHKRAP